VEANNSMAVAARQKAFMAGSLGMLCWPFLKICMSYSRTRGTIL